jgi:quercetin dioxygenase-like cupin family protein
MGRRRPALICISAAILLAASAWAAGDGATGAAAAAGASYAYATNGVLEDIRGGPGTTWKILLNESNLGGKELEAAEVTLPGGTAVPGHMHGSLEVIYVLSGTYGHEVNGKLYLLKPGMVGIARPGDKVRHLVPKASSAKLLILWVPAGEASRVLRQAKGVTPPPVPEAQAIDP